jgi:hypothetical protein
VKKPCEIKLSMPTHAAKAKRYIKKKVTHKLTPLPLRLNFSAGVPLRRFLRPLIAKKSNKATETQRRIKENLSSRFWLFFLACVSLWYLYINNLQKRSKKANSFVFSNPVNWLHGILGCRCHQLYIYLHLSDSKTMAPGVQWNNISFREMEHLKIKSNYVFASVVPSGLSYINALQKYIKKIYVSALQLQPIILPFCVWSFSASIPPIQYKYSRKGTGARL